jgi:hypothetical protein
MKIIADAYAALNPPDALWKEYLEEIDRLNTTGRISAEDYHLLRFSMEAKGALMAITLGDPEAFTEGTVDEILERARAAARRGVEVERDDEKRRRFEAEEMVRRSREALTAEEYRHVQRVQHIAQLVGFWFSRALWYALGFLVVVGTFLHVLACH